ncbi:MAG: ADP-ribosylglycohydrolase family protein [Candidatus Bathyarchaeia archaeon]
MRIEDLKQIVKDEIIQKREEGYDVAEVEERLQRIESATLPELKDFLEVLDRCPLRSDFMYKEPSDLSEIINERPRRLEKSGIKFSDEELLEKIYGGWLGRCAGCLLGKPVEGLTREQIETWLRIAGEYPLKDYFPSMQNLPEDAPKWLRDRLNYFNRLFERTGVGVLRGQISCMARDDDIDYTIINLHILENYGPNFTAMNVGEAWLHLLPYLQVYTAERAAYRNLVNGLEPPKTATHMNPYREWIGAQIRADMWGYVSPGNPELAAELAYRDASLSHVKNGIYGEMFVSAMISAAFTTTNIEEIIDAGLSVIPKKSRLAEAIKDVMKWSREYADWRDSWSRIFEKYGHYHFVHTINNAAIVAMGLLYGKEDYEKSIAISVTSGLDTDCNGATVGSILGVILGAKSLPEKWIKPLNDTLESYVIGYNNSKISHLAYRTLRIAKKLMET